METIRQIDIMLMLCLSYDDIRNKEGETVWFVLMGSFFLGGRASFGEGTSQQEEALLSLEPLSRVIARFPALASQSHFILLPGYSTFNQHDLTYMC